MNSGISDLELAFILADIADNVKLKFLEPTWRGIQYKSGWHRRNLGRQ